MAWQVRHKTAGLFMGVNHRKGHYSNVSECCRFLGVYKFTTPAEIEQLFDVASHPRLPPEARMPREDFTVEEWDFKAHDLLLDEALLDACHEYVQWSMSVFQFGLN